MSKLATVEQPSLVPVDTPAEESTALVNMIERFATNPDVSVDKLERLMAMSERMRAQVARERFNAAMSDAQKEMRPIAADADNPQTRSRYASYAKLDRALRPIYTQHGFGLSFNTADSPLSEHVRVVCDVTHSAGHEKPYHVDMPADGKGAKGGDVMTKTHAVGAAMSYGMRYLLKMIFNVAVGEDDKDGNVPPEAGQEPDRYADWVETLEDKAGEGMKALTDMWNTANRDKELQPLVRHLMKAHPDHWAALKAKAAKVGK